MEIDIDFGSNNPSDKEDVKDFITSVNDFMDKYWGIAVGIFGICTLILAGVVIYRLTSISASANDPQARKKAIKGLLLAVISAALMGSLTLYICLAYNFFR